MVEIIGITCRHRYPVKHPKEINLDKLYHVLKPIFKVNYEPESLLKRLTVKYHGNSLCVHRSGIVMVFGLDTKRTAKLERDLNEFWHDFVKKNLT